MDLLPLNGMREAPRSIRVLRARVSEEAAVDRFAHGFAGGLCRLARGPLRSIADVYIPFRLYRVSLKPFPHVWTAKVSENVQDPDENARPPRLAQVSTTLAGAGSPCPSPRLIFGIDAASGALDLYRFDELPASDDVVQVRTRNQIEPLLSTSAAHDLLVARLRRTVYQRAGFLAGGRVVLNVRPAADILHVPYWVGFFGRGDFASFVVMDAVRHQIEGAKVQRLIGSWIHALPTSAEREPFRAPEDPKERKDR
jgi:hypothetical protein